MENPASWPPEVRLIYTAMEEHEHEMKQDPPVFGVSVYMRIYNELKEAGMLKESNAGSHT